MTKLAIVRQKYRPDGGAERFVASALNALEQTNELDITVLTREWQGNTQNHYQVEICNPFKWGRISREKGFATAVAKHFSKFDLVQSHERIPGCDIFRAGDGVHKCWLEHKARILSPFKAKQMKNSRYHRYVMAAEKAMFEHHNLKAVICNSNMVKDEICANFNIAPQKVHTIYNSVNTDKFSPQLKSQYRESIRQQLAIPEQAKVMLFVGSGFERKGLQATIQAITNTDSHLIVVGKDKQQQTYQQLAQTEGCDSRVHFVGMCSEPEAYYGAADGFILPTLYDPFPNVVLEAMASGLGVITSRTCGGAEIIKQGVNGYVTDALDIESLSQAIQAFDEPTIAVKLGHAARQTVESFTSTRLKEQLLHLYQSLLDEK